MNFLGIDWVSVTFGELLGIVWVSVTFGEHLLHWAGSERRPGDGSSGAGHPGRGVRGASAPRLTPLPVSRAAPAAGASLRSSALHVRPTPGQKPGPHSDPPSLWNPWPAWGGVIFKEMLGCCFGVVFELNVQSHRSRAH